MTLYPRRSRNGWQMKPGYTHYGSFWRGVQLEYLRPIFCKPACWLIGHTYDNYSQCWVCHYRS